MYYQGSIPFLRLTVSLAAGIGLGLFAIPYGLFKEVQFGCLIALLLLLLLSYFLKGRYKFSDLQGVTMISANIVFGITLSLGSLGVHSDSYFFKDPARFSNYTLRITEPLEEKENSYRAAAEVLSGIDTQFYEQQLSGKILVYWPKKRNENKPIVTYGDLILIHNAVLPMPAAAFPNDFDFKAVMRYRNVQDQIFLSEGDWLKTGNKSNFIFSSAYAMRNWLIGTIESTFPSNIAGLLESLLIGLKDHLEKEDVKAFTVSGTTHVLAVSGMHVGLIYLVLVLLLTGKTKVKRVRIYQGIIILFALWLYALITGLSASVVRATVMFSIIHIGQSFFKREGQIFNSLFAAAYMQLIFSPLNLIDVGFQLSYLAVLGILFLYPYIYRLWIPEQKIIRFAWQMAAVSIAATIATLPVSLYFFGVFPLWFIPANIIIVPLSTFLIFLAIATIVLLKIPLLGFILVHATGFVSWLLISVTRGLAALPYASIQNIVVDEMQVLLLFAFILGLALYFVNKVQKAIWISAVAAFLFGLWGLFTDFQNRRKSEIVVAEIRNQLIVLLRSGDSALVLSGQMKEGLADSLFEFQKMYCKRNGIRKVLWHSRPVGDFQFGPFMASGSRNHIFVSIDSARNYCVVWDPKELYTVPDNGIVFAAYRHRNLFYNGREPELLRNNFRLLLD